MERKWEGRFYRNIFHRWTENIGREITENSMEGSYFKSGNY